VVNPAAWAAHWSAYQAYLPTLRARWSVLPPDDVAFVYGVYPAPVPSYDRSRAEALPLGYGGSSAAFDPFSAPAMGMYGASVTTPFAAASAGPGGPYGARSRAMPASTSYSASRPGGYPAPPAAAARGFAADSLGMAAAQSASLARFEDDFGAMGEDEAMASLGAPSDLRKKSTRSTGGSSGGGWGGMLSSMFGAGGAAPSAPAPTSMPMPASRPMAPVGPPSSARDMPAAEARKPSPAAAGGGLDALILLQTADGSFALDEALARAAGTTLAKLSAAAAALASGGSAPAGYASAAEAARGRAFATALALHLLRTRYASLEEEWVLLAPRSEAYVRGVVGGGADVAAFVSAAGAALAAAA
jgi:hypothetical protein